MASSIGADHYHFPETTHVSKNTDLHLKRRTPSSFMKKSKKRVIFDSQDFSLYKYFKVREDLLESTIGPRRFLQKDCH